MKIYICSMHLEVEQDKSGKCPKCGLALISGDEVQSNSTGHTNDISLSKTSWKNYLPLYIIVGLIFITSLVILYIGIYK